MPSWKNFCKATRGDDFLRMQQMQRCVFGVSVQKGECCSSLIYVRGICGDKEVIGVGLIIYVFDSNSPSPELKS